MLYLNLFSEGGALLETAPQADASQPVRLTAEAEAVVRSLIVNDDVAALARLFPAGATAGERAVR